MMAYRFLHSPRRLFVAVRALGYAALLALLVGASSAHLTLFALAAVLGVLGSLLYLRADEHIVYLLMTYDVFFCTLALYDVGGSLIQILPLYILYPQAVILVTKHPESGYISGTLATAGMILLKVFDVANEVPANSLGISAEVLFWIAALFAMWAFIIAVSEVVRQRVQYEADQKSAGQAALYRTVSRIRAAETSEGMLNAARDSLIAMTGAQSGRCALWAGFEGVAMPYTASEYDTLKALAESGHSIIVPDLSTAPLAEVLREGLIQGGAGAAMWLPLRLGVESVGATKTELVGVTKTELVGVIEIAFAERNHVFPPEQIALCEKVADETVRALEDLRIRTAEQRQRHLSIVLQESTELITSALSLNAILDRLLDYLSDLLPYDRAVIALVEGRTIRILIGQGFPEDQKPQAITWPVSEGTLWHALFENREPITVPDVQQEDRWIPLPGSESARSWIGLPILSRNKLWGLLSLDKDIPFSFTDDQAELAFAVAKQAAIAIENAQLYEETRRRADQLVELSNASLELTLDPAEIPEHIHRAIRKITHVDASITATLDSNGHSIKVDVWDDDTRIPLFSHPYHPDEDLMSWVIENERTVFWETGEARDRLNCPLTSWKGRQSFPCLLSIPLNARGKVIGSLTIEMKQRRALTEADFWALTALSNSIAVGLDNARLYRSEQTRRQLADNLLQASKAIGSDIKNLREVLDRILRQLYSVVKYDLASIQTGEPGEPRTIIYFDLDRTLDTTSLTLSSNSPEAGIVHTIMRNRETILLNDAPQDAGWRPDAPNWSDKAARSWIGSVLAVQDEVLGVLTVQFKEPHTYTDEDAEVVEAFAQQAAIALENARLYSEEAQRAEREKDEVRRIKALETLRMVTAHVPLPVVREIYRRRGDEPGDIIRHLDAVMAVADISGFTAMTEALNDAGQDGLEELTHLLNRYLSTMVNLAETHGGQVIGFGGDSLIVMWPVAEGNWIRTVKRAVHFALQMQAGMRAFTEVRTQKGIFTIDTRVGLSAGSIAEVHAGGIIRAPGVNLPRWIYMLMGPPLRRIAEAQRLAEPGQVVVAPEAWQMAASDLYGFEIENGFRGLEGVVWSANEFTEEPLPDWERLSTTETPNALEHLQYYVSHRLFNSDQEIAIPPDAFLDLSVVFVGLHGIDTIEEPDLFRLQDYVSAVEEVIYAHDGHINKVTAGEYGVELLLYFDSQPEESRAERNVRATACVLEMKRTADRYDLRQRCGMDSGVVFMGTVGCATRRELTVIGTQVNIAARLMQGAEDGQQCLTEAVFRDIDGHFTCKCLGEVQIKNIQSPVVIYTVSKSAGQDFSMRLIPHQSESATGR